MRDKPHCWNRVSLAALILSCLASATSPSPSQSAQSTAKPELIIQTGHSSRINRGVFAPNGKWFASGGADNLIKIWDVESGLELRALTGHQNWIRSLAVSSAGQLLASGSNDRTIRIWNVSSGRELLTLSGHEGVVDAVLFSPDNRWIISGSSDQTIRIWDTKSGAQVQVIKDQPAGVTAMAISSDGKTLAAGLADGSVKLWSATDWTLQRTLSKQGKPMGALGFSPDNRSLFAGGADGEVALWDTSNGKARQRMKPGQTGVLDSRFVSEQELLLATSDGAVSSWDTTTGKIKQLISTSDDSADLLFAAFSNDARFVAISAGNRTVEIRSLPDGKTARTLSSHAAAFFSIAASRDGRWLASAANDRSVRLWQIATGREMPRLSGHTGWAQALAFSPDSRQLASGSNSGEVKLWDVNAGRAISSQSYAGDRIHAVAFSPDGRLVASAGTGQTIHLLDLSSKQTRNVTGHEGEITSLAFVPNSSLIASASIDKTIRLCDVTTGNMSKTLQLSDEVNTIAISPDGGLLAAGTAGKKIELFDLKAGGANANRTLTGHTGEIFSLAFSGNGRWLASAGLDQKARLWDPRNGNEVRVLTASSGEINGIDFTSDAKFLISANSDGSMNVWNTETGDVTAQVVSIPESDNWLVVTPGGLFDGSPAAWKLLLWRFAKSTFNVAPVESFFNEFYYPGLLADILADKNPKPKQDIVKKDRRQPVIRVASEDSSGGATAKRTIQLKLEIAEAKPDNENGSGSGAKDLRLFRNGLLVQAWSGDVLQGASRRTIETSVPIVAGENEFTAYAFNRDNVKSTDSLLHISGAETLRRRGTAYLLAIGVSEYANSQYNLNYSVADANEIAAQLKQQQEALARYQPIETISLLNEDATKENILLALKLLAGTAKGPLPKSAARDLQKIKPAQPEDAVVFYFSGHGTAQGDRFYLIPHDLGYAGPRSELNQAGLAIILAHSISDEELEEVLRPLDADQLLLVIDACNSGQALQAEEARRGPMNTRGIAQLAYEKGMYVLTASQSDEVAFESAGLKHSYLAYALVEEGIKSGAADADGNGQIFLNEWFNYATDRVPRIRSPKQVAGKQLEEVDEDEKRVQRPRVFDMREGGAERFIIARLAARAQSQ